MFADLYFIIRGLRKNIKKQNNTVAILFSSVWMLYVATVREKYKIIGAEIAFNNVFILVAKQYHILL